MPNNNPLPKAELLSEAELYASLGFPQPDSKPKKETGKEEKNFLTAQYPILSTPYFLIYLQGPATFVDYLPPQDSPNYLEAFFSNAKIRRLGRAKTTPAITRLTKEVLDGAYKLFYTDKSFHMNTLRTLVEEGATVDKNKCLNKAEVYKAIDNYLDDLSTFLQAKGYNSNEEYINASPQTIKEVNKLTMEDLEAGWDSL